jgi:hypothetical protein
MFTWMMRLWCRRVHRRAMWPIHGKYICSRCLREYPVNWESPRPAALYAEAVPVAPALNGSADSSTYRTRARRSMARNGFSKKCTSVAGMP